MALTKVSQSLTAFGQDHDERINSAQRAIGLTPQDFGAIGDGVTDDTSAMQQWLAALSLEGRKGAATKDAIYRVTATLPVGPCEIDWNGATWFMDANVAAFDAFAEPTVVTLAVDYIPGSTTLTVAALPFAPAKGTKIKLHSDARDPANRDNGAASNQYRAGEWAVLDAGSTETTLVLSSPLRHVEGIDPSSPSRIPAYTTAMNTRVLVLQPVSLRWRNLTIRYRPGQAWTSSVGGFFGFDGVTLEGISHRDIYGSAASVQGSYGVRYSGLRADNVQTYGVGVAGGSTVIDGAIFTSCRHAITTNEVTAAAGTSNIRSMLGCGRVGALTVTGASSEGGDLAGFDTHHGAEGAVFSGCLSKGGKDYGFQARGRGNVFSSPVISGRKGILGFTEYAGTDGAPFLNGKTAADLTDLAVTSPTIDCVETPIKADCAFMTVAGSGVYRSNDHRMFHNVGGELRISGSHRCTVLPGGGVNSTGMIHVEDVPAGLGGITQAVTIIEAGADITIDARQATATGIEGLRAAANTLLIVRGTVTFLFPASHGNLLSGGGEIRTEGAGVIRYSREGAAGSTMTLNRTNKDVRIEALDGTLSLARIENEPFPSRASAELARIPNGRTSLSYFHNGSRYDFQYDASGTALTTADGKKWSPLGEITPFHFGALGNNSNDDAPAFQKALDYALATGRHTVRVASGLFRFGSTVYFHGERQKLLGAGRDHSVIKAASGFTPNAYFLQIGPAATVNTPFRRMVIDGFRFEGAIAGSGGGRARGIGMINSALYTITNNSFQGVTKGIEVYPSENLPDITAYQPGGPHISFNNFDTTEEAIIIRDGTQHFLTNNWFVSGSTVCILLENNDKATIMGCEFNNWTDTAIKIITTKPALPSRNNMVTGNRFHGSGLPAINEGAGCNWNIFTNNQMWKGDPIIKSGAQTVVAGNNGFLTDRRALVTIPAGQTSVTIIHGVSFVSGAYDVQVTPRSDVGDGRRWWVSNVTGTSFNINISSAAAGGLDFIWRVNSERYFQGS